MGSEGTLGIVTKVWVRLTPDPQDYRAMRAISLASPMRATPCANHRRRHHSRRNGVDGPGDTTAVEEAFQFGFPPDAAAVLVIEVDGPAVGLDRQQQQIVEFCKRFGARELHEATSAGHRELLWKCRNRRSGPPAA